jgi:uncharacterized protein
MLAIINGMLPTIDEITALHKKYAPSDEAFKLVFTHCLIVRDIADELLATNPHPAIDSELVRVGCLIHDIGVYSLFENGKLNKETYITHGIRGYDILTSEGYEEKICRIASHHTGVGLSRADIKDQSLPLPDEDFLAETAEERLVMYADKFHSKHPRFNTYETYRKTVARFGEEKVERFDALAQEFGKPNLTDLAEKYGHPLV